MRAFEDASFGHHAVDVLIEVATKGGFGLPAFVYMPDHAHVVTVGHSDSCDVREFVYEWKKRTGFAWRQRGNSRLWEQGYWDNHLRRGNTIASLIRYVVLNPVRAGIVSSPRDYPLLGSTDYTIDELEWIAGTGVGGTKVPPFR